MPLPVTPVPPKSVSWLHAVPVKLVSPDFAMTRRPVTSSHAKIAVLLAVPRLKLLANTTTPESLMHNDELPEMPA